MGNSRFKNIQKKHIQISLLLLGLFLEFFSPLAAQAMTLQDLADIHNQHTFFKVSDTATKAPTPCAPASDTPAAIPAGGKLFMIGDSIAAGSTSDLTNSLTSAGFAPVDIDAVASRSLTIGTTAINGLSVLQNDADRYKDASVIVVELGTNGGLSDANIQAAINIINTNNTVTHSIYWVNIGVVNSQRTDTGKTPIDTATLNATLTRNMGLGYKIIDWASVVATHPEYINPADGLGVHPTIQGRVVFANTIEAGVSGGAVASKDGCGGTIQLNGSDNAARIFNFLIAQGLTPLQAAGLMGNLQAEAHFDPKLVQYGKPMAHGGLSQYPPTCDITDFNDPDCHDDTLLVNGISGYGIAQWTSSGRQQGLKDAAANAIPPTIPGDLGTQLNFLWKELTTSYLGSVLTPLKATNDLRTATDIVLKKFECPQPCVDLIKNPNPTTQAAYDKVLNDRFNLATGILNKFGSPGGP